MLNYDRSNLQFFHQSQIQKKFIPDSRLGRKGWGRWSGMGWKWAVLSSVGGCYVATSTLLQNAAARLVLRLSPLDHVSSALPTLHWLPIYYRIQFKVALLMYNALAGRCPEYINDIMAPVASNPARKQLRSAARSYVIVPRCRTKFGSRAFSVAGPEVWNRLPQSVQSADTVRQFRRLL